MFPDYTITDIWEADISQFVLIAADADLEDQHILLSLVKVPSVQAILFQIGIIASICYAAQESESCTWPLRSMASNLELKLL